MGEVRTKINYMKLHQYIKTIEYFIDKVKKELDEGVKREVKCDKLYCENKN